MRAVIAVVALAALMGCTKKNPFWDEKEGKESCLKFSVVYDKVEEDFIGSFRTPDFKYKKEIEDWLEKYGQAESIRHDVDSALFDGPYGFTWFTVELCKKNPNWEVRKAAKNIADQIIAKCKNNKDECVEGDESENKDGNI